MLLILAFVACAGAAAYYVITDESALRIRDVQVLLNSKPHSNQYEAMASALEEDFQSHVGTFLWNLNLSELASTLRSVSWVKNFSVSRSLLGQVSVELDTEEMAALWARPDGRLYPISNTGKVLEPLELSEAPDLPILRSVDFEKQPENSYLLSELLDELAVAPALGSTNIRNLHFTTKRGFAVELFDPDVVIEFGYPPYPTKVQRVEKVVQYLQRHELRSRVIDATFAKKVLVRARKAPYAQ